MFSPELLKKLRSRNGIKFNSTNCILIFLKNIIYINVKISTEIYCVKCAPDCCRLSSFPLQVRMLAWLLLFLPPVSSAQRSEPVFSAITKSVLPPDYENNPTQLNYGVAVTDVDGDGDLEMFVAG